MDTCAVSAVSVWAACTGLERALIFNIKIYKRCTEVTDLTSIEHLRQTRKIYGRYNYPIYGAKGTPAWSPAVVVIWSYTAQFHRAKGCGAIDVVWTFLKKAVISRILAMMIGIIMSSGYALCMIYYAVHDIRCVIANISTKRCSKTDGTIVSPSH